MRDAIKIFVGNVDDRTTQEELTELFQKYGAVVSCAVMKQYAFVHMRALDSATKAIEELNGRELHGKKLVVELSKPRPQNTWKIFIGNVGSDCEASTLRALFETYGKVVECDVVKGAFDDDDIIHVEGSVNPVRDIEIIHEELRLKDEEAIAAAIDKLEKVAVRGGDKKLKPEYDIMCKVKSWVLEEKNHVRYYHDWNDKEIEVLNKYLFLTSKPMIYLVNLSEKDYIRKKNKWRQENTGNKEEITQ